MPRLSRPKVSIRSFWTGLAGLAVAFAVSMGGLNAWQLANRGVPVLGRDAGLYVMRGVSCGRDPLTLWQGWQCAGQLQTEYTMWIEFTSATELSGTVDVRVFEDSTKIGAQPQVVPVGTNYVWATMMPTDLAAMVWLAVLAALPLGLAIGGGMKRTRPEPENRFDALASSWDDDPVKADRAQQVASAIIGRTSPGGHWLDYGAGTGALGLSLLGHVDQITLADSSAGMLAAATQKIAANGLAERAQTIELDLSTADADAGRFDGVVSLLTLHHIEDARSAVGRLAAMLRPGGWLALSDLDAEDGSFHGEHSPHAHHHGFDRARMAQWFTELGLVDIDVSTPYALSKGGRAYPLFLVVGRKSQ